MRYEFIINPAAGRGRAGKLKPEVVAEAKRLFTDADFHLTESAGDARALAGRLKNASDVVVAVGGDGTIHEVVNGLMNGRASLGIVPIGSGNDFARMMGLTPDYVAALQIIRRGTQKSIDIGQVNDSYFANGIGIGFDAEVVVKSLKIKYLRGFLIYLSAVLQTLIKYKNITVSVSNSGELRDDEIFLMTLGNGRSMGGGFYLTPDAIIDDGLLDICLIKALNRREALINLPKVVKGQHKEMRQVSFFRTKEIRIESETGFPAHADGELIGTDIRRLDVKIIPAALKVIHNLSMN